MTSEPPIAAVEFSDLQDALLFISAGPFDHHAYIDAHTGEIIWVSDDLELDDEVPEDLEISDRYIPIPPKNNLDLGRGLALRFSEDELQGQFDTVAGFFRKKGAFSCFKAFLEARGMLEEWFTYEARETEKALRSWCQENGIPLVPEQRSR